MSKGKKNKRKRPGRGRQASERAGVPKSGTGGLHITIGTGPSRDAATGQLSLADDARLLKAALLYADRVKLASAGSAITLGMVATAALGPDGQLDFLERHFRENLSRDAPEEAATGVEFVRRYRELRQGRNVPKDMLPKRLEWARELGEIWAEFREGWEAFARTAGVGEIQAARRSGYVDVADFAAGGLERGAALAPDARELRSEEYWEEVTAETFGMLSDAVAGGKTHPMFDDKAGELVRLGIEAGAISVSETGRARSRHGGLASDLLRRLPLFDEASVDEVLGVRSALEAPLVKFRSEVSRYSNVMLAQGWDEDFAADAEDVFVREVAPAVQEIEEMVRTDRALSTLWQRMNRPQDWALGPTLGVATYTLASFPEIAALSVAGGVGLAGAIRNARAEHREARSEIEGHGLFFYREAGRRLEVNPAPRPDDDVYAKASDRHFELYKHLTTLDTAAGRLGPLSGSGPKLEDARGRYLPTAFCYGTNMGPAQTARHTRGLVTAHELGYVNRRHVSVQRPDAATTDVVKAYAGLDLPRVWGNDVIVESPPELAEAVRHKAREVARLYD